MINFNELLAEYLELYGQVVRERGMDIEFRGIQYQLNTLAKIVREEDIRALLDELEDLKEWASEFSY